MAHTPGVAAVATRTTQPARDVAEIAAYPTTSPQSEQTAALVNQLRDHVIPPIATATHATVDIGGNTASGIDFSHVLSSKLPLFIGIVVALSALLLMIVFRSLLIPLQGAAMNLLSIGASLGVTQAIFQRGLARRPDRHSTRTDRRVHPRIPIRDRIRTLYGLRGLPRLPHPRTVAATPRQLRRHSRGIHPHRARDHRRRRGDGARIRILRDQPRRSISNCSESRLPPPSSSTRSSYA